MSKERAAQLVDAGIWLKLSGDIEGASRLFERALKLDPDNDKARELLAQDPAEAVMAPHAPEQTVPAANPFERAPSAPSASDLDWGAATGLEPTSTPAPFVPPVEPVHAAEPEVPPGLVPVAHPSVGTPLPATSSPSGLGDDWGRATGQSPSPIPMHSSDSVWPQTAMFGAGSVGATRQIPSPVPQVAPVIAPTGTSGLRQTLPYAAPSETTPRTTLPFASQGQPKALESAPPTRQTMMFATLSGASSAPFGPAPTFVPPAAAVAPPSIAPISTNDEQVPRNTLTFSSSLSGPIEPSSMPEVKPVVIKLGSDENESELPSIVDSLRAEVDAKRKTPVPETPLLTPRRVTLIEAPDPLKATSIVITDRAPDPSPPRATPPMFTDEEPMAFDPPSRRPVDSTPSATIEVSADFSDPVARPHDDAWNWSASSAAVEAPIVPRPSPQLTAEASTAWDQRSNPGISLADVTVPNQTIEFVSSSSKVTKPPEVKREEVAVLVRGAKDLIELDDHTGAMELIAKAQAIAPEDPDVTALRERSERTLLAMFESKLGPLEKVPRVLLKDDEIIWLNLDHRAGFVLAQIDGSMTFEDVFAVSGMSRIDTARILAQLVDEGVISRG